MMKSQNNKLFVQLCESIVQEATTLSTILSGDPAAKKLISYLHREVSPSIPHDQEYEMKDSISWADINNTLHGAWIIIKFANGLGAIKAKALKGGYTTVAVDPNTGKAEWDGHHRGEEAVSWFKDMNLGGIKKIYVGVDKGKAQEKKTVRGVNRSELIQSQSMTRERLVKKFKPLWKKVIESAIADIKGMAATMLQNGAYQQANKKIEWLGDLETIVNEIDQGNLEYAEKPITVWVSSALALAAAHFYPEETGSLLRSASTGEIAPAAMPGWKGINILLKDIQQGDNAKLSVVLGFFKKCVIAIRV